MFNIIICKIVYSNSGIYEFVLLKMYTYKYNIPKINKFAVHRSINARAHGSRYRRSGSLGERWCYRLRPFIFHNLRPPLGRV